MTPLPGLWLMPCWEVAVLTLLAAGGRSGRQRAEPCRQSLWSGGRTSTPGRSGLRGRTAPAAPSLGLRGTRRRPRRHQGRDVPPAAGRALRAGCSSSTPRRARPSVTLNSQLSSYTPGAGSDARIPGLEQARSRASGTTSRTSRGGRPAVCSTTRAEAVLAVQTGPANRVESAAQAGLRCRARARPGRASLGRTTIRSPPARRINRRCRKL